MTSVITITLEEHCRICGDCRNSENHQPLTTGNRLCHRRFNSLSPGQLSDLLWPDRGTRRRRLKVAWASPLG